MSGERHSGRERRSGCRCTFGQQEQRLVSRVGVWVEGVKVESAGDFICVLMMGHSSTPACAQLGDCWACRAGRFEEDASPDHNAARPEALSPAQAAEGAQAACGSSKF